MGFLKNFIFVVLVLGFQSAFAGLEAPPLHVMSYDALKFPPSLNKPEVQWMLQTAFDGLYGKAFVDMGDVTDLMHGHVILRPKTADKKYTFSNILENADMADTVQGLDLEPVAILFHSQEYDFLRKKMPYLGPWGELDPYNRNWVLFLVDTKDHKRGELVDANEFYQAKDGSKTFTIEPHLLPDDLFGFDIDKWSYSFYFFRTDCSASETLAVQPEVDNNLMEVYNSLKKERVCLVITSFNCRNHPEDTKNCAGPEVPLYDIFKGWKKP